MEDEKERRKHAVSIIQEGSSRMIRPAEVLLSEGDKITFYNLTSGLVTVLFPDERLFGQNVLKLNSEPSKPLKVKKEAELGSFPYSVFCHDTKEFAHASLPRIIVYRKLK